jgi:four helix bundle protein
MKEQIHKSNIKNDKQQAFKRRLYSFVLKLIGFLDTLPKDTISLRITDQLVRSGTSILSNYIEGSSASSKREYLNFFQYSLKSANESKVWLAILRDTRRLQITDANTMLGDLEEISNIFAASILTMKGKR